jgi:peptidyl-prolyl cis-trans isomerase A (cyclophilin A)
VRVPFVRSAFLAGAISLAVFSVGCSKKAEEAPAAGVDEKAPAVFRANFDTSKGGFVVEVTRDWAPLGADRFYTLVKSGFFDNARFFRVLPGFMVQFGLAADPAQNKRWGNLIDDPVKESNKPGFVTFAAASSPNTRTTQVFINYGDNARLDGQGFAAFGKVVSGMDIVQQLYSDYGEGAPQGAGPAQDQIQGLGNTYLEKEFPKLDYIKTAKLAGN